MPPTAGTASRLTPRWGTGTGTDPDDFANNNFAGLSVGSDLLLHRRTTAFAGTDTISLGMRINGMGFEEAADSPSSDALAAAWRPYIETTIGLFGAGRCMFESNFPVDKGSYGYGVFLNACKTLASGASADERRALFSGTAARFYRFEGVGG